ncbi:diacylglycerol kinase (ATP) [Desulfonispora thiosulfatigenes DSM 11270]|uniref:Diacylglycerol kinase (ATP) n=1 Tax=Desulfonispora thiosulfatigenes DSM 11270 TaxID=656914 RepID=A0A1W1UK41_DESTI|nr:diacylglycerol kinase family protein [Desulfonispora thiosulfatigenes]SMB81114.1 diacylglycerol kinase (ATP) [Desulfonispora thiosulfatigenes DSM 11270]
MRKVKIIENPSSGKNLVPYFQKRINLVINILIDRGYVIHKFQTKKKDDAYYETVKACNEKWDAIIVSGGDGTVNEVCTGIAKSIRKIPVGILAEGTVNDFATIMNLPKDPKEFCDMIDNWNTQKVDLGKVNDKCFMNVVASGFLSNVAHITPIEYKSIFGRVAYVAEGIKQFPKQVFKKMQVKITSEEYCSKEQEEIMLFLLSNTSSIGGFKNAIPTADATDGYLDCMIVKSLQSSQEFLDVFWKIISGKHTQSANVIHFKTKKVVVEIYNEEIFDIDVDGEYAGQFPATFEILPNAFEIFIK